MNIEASGINTTNKFWPSHYMHVHKAPYNNVFHLDINLTFQSFLTCICSRLAGHQHAYDANCVMYSEGWTIDDPRDPFRIAIVSRPLLPRPPTQNRFTGLEMTTQHQSSSGATSIPMAESLVNLGVGSVKTTNHCRLNHSDDRRKSS